MIVYLKRLVLFVFFVGWAPLVLSPVWILARLFSVRFNEFIAVQLRLIVTIGDLVVAGIIVSLSAFIFLGLIEDLEKPKTYFFP